MKQSILNLETTLGYINRNSDADSYYTLMVSQYIAQIIFEQPFLRFSPRGAK